MTHTPKPIHVSLQPLNRLVASQCFGPLLNNCDVCYSCRVQRIRLRPKHEIQNQLKNAARRTENTEPHNNLNEANIQNIQKQNSHQTVFYFDKHKRKETY